MSSATPPVPRSRLAAPARTADGFPRWWEACRIVLALWAVALLAGAAGVAFAGTMGDLGCERPPGSSQYGEAELHLVPAGVACRYGDVGSGDVDGPGAGALAFQLTLLLVPLAAWVVAGRLPDDLPARARRELVALAVASLALCAVGFALAGLLEAGPERLLWPLAAAAALAAAGLGAALVAAPRREPSTSTDRF